MGFRGLEFDGGLGVLEVLGVEGLSFFFFLIFLGFRF